MPILWNEAWEIGRAGERALREWLMAHGLYVVPMADINSYRNRAPSLEAKQEAIALPDLQVFGDQLRGWVEVKTKNRATLYHKTNTWWHGVTASHWEAYLRVAATSGMTGYLVILEQTPAYLVLVQTFEVLNHVKRLYDGDRMPDHKPEYFFPRLAFDVYAGPDSTAGARLPTAPPQAPRSIADGVAPPQLSLGLDVSGLGSAADARDLHMPPLPGAWNHRRSRR